MGFLPVRLPVLLSRKRRRSDTSWRQYQHPAECGILDRSGIWIEEGEVLWGQGELAFRILELFCPVEEKCELRFG